MQVQSLGRSSGEGNGNQLHYSCLGNPMDRGAWWATVHGVTKKWTHLSTQAYTHARASGPWHHVLFSSLKWGPAPPLLPTVLYILMQTFQEPATDQCQGSSNSIRCCPSALFKPFILPKCPPTSLLLPSQILPPGNGGSAPVPPTPQDGERKTTSS